MKRLYLLLFICAFSLYAHEVPLNGKHKHIEALYHGLDSQSIFELFAFYYLYPETTQGKQALQTAWDLINRHRLHPEKPHEDLILPQIDIEVVLALINQQGSYPSSSLPSLQLDKINTFSSHLKNRQLKGFQIWNKHDIPHLDASEIDLARALLLYQFEKECDQLKTVEATLDLMALQVLARLDKDATPYDKIQALNQFIFYDMRFRFPPHSLWVKNIDHYTFLPSVLDNRKGVCLGVSILYLSLAQRIGLSLEIITPPGHIYLCYQTPENTLNIETTARGISYPSKTYLSMNTYHLQTRTIKEVIGLYFINQAAGFLTRKEYTSAIERYEQALSYLKNDPQLKMLLGYHYLFVGKKEKGKALLKQIQNTPFDGTIHHETIPGDYLKGAVDVEGIQAALFTVDDTRASIMHKQKLLKTTLKKYPKFQEGIFQLAISYLQLGRGQEALDTLMHYHTINPNHPTVEYYIAILQMERFSYEKGWHHLKRASSLVQAKNHNPLCLKQLKYHMQTLYPDPDDTTFLQKR